MEADPECYLVHDEMCRTGGVAHLHRATLAGPAAYAESLPRRLRELPGLPQPVAEFVEGELTEPDVYLALIAAGRDPADRGEPSWAALGTMLRETRFTQLYHRLNFMGEKWAVDTRDTALKSVVVLKGHPLLPVIDSYCFDPRRDPDEVRVRLLAAPVLDAKAHGYYFRLQRVDQKAAQEWLGGPALRTRCCARPSPLCLRCARPGFSQPNELSAAGEPTPLITRA